MICPTCNKEFHFEYWRKRKYCSQKCYKKIREKHIVNCISCNKQIKIIGNRYKKSKTKRFTCSRKCMGIYNRGINNPNYDNHKLLGKNNPNWKDKHLIKCLECNKEILVKHCLKEIRKFCSRECQHKYSVGENASGWKGGKSNEDYPYTFNEKLKTFVRKRDGHKCQVCGVPQQECIKALCVHHIDYNKMNSEVNNLISLCYKCHNKTVSNRNYWTKYFQKIILIKEGEKNGNFISWGA